MFKTARIAATAAALALAGSAQAADITGLLKDADHFRTGAENLRVETQVTVLNKDGSTDKERLYTVFAQAQHKSLVLMRSPVEAGQKVLMLGDDFWLLMPGSARPMRITPSQKLLGDASTGDIATMSWAEDYSGNLVGDEACPAESAASKTCLHLSLAAARKGLSYQRIELWLGKAKHEPVAADLYVLSEKLAKQARFVMDKAGAQVTEMVLLDQLSNHRETRVRYVSRQAKQVPETWLNPMYLAKNPSLE